ncbi:LysM peptidoglycan-binding domain-containing protein [Pseudomonas sp. MAP12]|uniref:LysM peptidoglycan-binding domain-containing protein n=1 Tax=Geopseudomonas aromaticivorans TaxID=2849492 RepID=A0ABS6MQY9_9GAMM|nr:LysM peptidoglycan-binding domain-containing protein [Pseudomonas aromaticivorans]MBV2131214.1 LysM peptidoglycan-binding domain-containing protein [Pseudomonas aromaticivorans]
MSPPTPPSSAQTAAFRALQLLLVGLLVVLAGCQSRGGAEPASSVSAGRQIEWSKTPAPQEEQHGDIWERIRAGYKLQDQIGTNPRVERQRFGFASHPASIQRTAERSSPYIHYIVERLEENDMPLELALLPMIESSYNPMAYSPAHAAGLWQFIPSTGRHYNLRQTNWYDGRRDITASTNAAISYLKRLHDMFNGDWLLALAAYNAGEGTVSRAIERNQQRNLPTDYWNLPLPRETQDYVPKLLAVSQIIQTPTSYGVALAPIANAPYFEQVAIRHQLDLTRVAAMADVDKDELLQLNPAFKQGITLDGPRHLLVPVAKADGLSESLARLQPDSLMQWQRYQVRRGDSLDSIAKRHGVATSTLRDLNQLPDRRVRTGQALLIPQVPGTPMQEERSEPAVAASSETAKPALRRYRVRKGDTLWSVAKQHNVAVADLQRWSKLKGKSIHAGQVLTLREDSPRPAATVKTGGDSRQSVTYYKVRHGDSLSDIAERFAVGTHHLKQWNPSLGHTPKPGQTLTLYLGRR